MGFDALRWAGSSGLNAVGRWKRDGAQWLTCLAWRRPRSMLTHHVSPRHALCDPARHRHPLGDRNAGGPLEADDVAQELPTDLRHGEDEGEGEVRTRTERRIRETTGVCGGGRARVVRGPRGQSEQLGRANAKGLPERWRPRIRGQCLGGLDSLRSLPLAGGRRQLVFLRRRWMHAAERGPGRCCDRMPVAGLGRASRRRAGD